MATCTPAGPADYVKLQPINTVQSIPTKSANTILLGSVKSVATRSTHNVDGAHHTANDFHSAGTCLLWQSPPPADVITRPPNNRVNTLTLIQPSGRLARQPLMHLYISVALGTSALELIGCGQLLASIALYLLVRSTPHPARISNFKPALKN